MREHKKEMKLKKKVRQTILKESSKIEILQWFLRDSIFKKWSKGNGRKCIVYVRPKKSFKHQFVDSNTQIEKIT